MDAQHVVTLPTWRLTRALMLAAFLPLRVSGQDSQDSTASVPKPVQISFALSGGISNGSYQAGVMATILAFMRASNDGEFGPPESVPKYVMQATAGASAGAINSIAIPIMWCSARVPLSQSQLWNTWIPVGLTQLLSGDSKPAAVFSRRFFDKQLDSIYTLVQKQTCEDPVLIAITLTRARPRQAPTGMDGVTIPTQRAIATFLLGVKGLEKRTDLTLGRSGETLNLTEPKDSALIKAILASSAFPVAFDTVNLKYDSAGKEVNADFYDGGVFENTPLPTLKRLLTDSSTSRVSEGSWTIFVSPGLRHPSARIPASEELPQGLGILTQRFSDLIPTGRAYELSLLLRSSEEAQWLGSQVHPSYRKETTFGPTLGGFGAFVSRSFREYDFIAGAADGLRYAAQYLSCADPVARRRGQCVAEENKVDSVATDLLSRIKEVADDGRLKPHIAAILTRHGPVAAEEPASRRDRVLQFYVANVPILDTVASMQAREDTSTSISWPGLQTPLKRCERPARGIMCDEGLGPLFRLLENEFGRELAPSDSACVWDPEALEWSEAWKCADEGFLEASPTERSVFGPAAENLARRLAENKFTNFQSWITQPAETYDLLLNEVSKRLLGGVPADQRFAARGAWWLARSTIAPPAALARTNTTYALGATMNRHWVPYRISVLAPFKVATGTSIIRVGWLVSEAKRARESSWSPGVILEFGGERGARRDSTTTKPIGSLLASLALKWRVPAAAIELGVVARCGTWPCTHAFQERPFLTGALPAFVKVGLLDAVMMGVEYGDAAPGREEGRGARLLFGLNDLYGLWWLFTG